MKGLAPLFLGIFGTFAFSWIGLTVIPTWQIGHLNPESDEEGTDVYPRPQSGMFDRGAHVYAANGCVYCHSQQVRADYIADDIERKWGNRRSAPRDYIFDRPVFLGKMRMGQDIANIGARAPAPEESPAPAGAASPPAEAPAKAGPAAQGAAASPAAAQAASPPPAAQGAAVPSPPAAAPAKTAPPSSPASSPGTAPAGAPGSSPPTAASPSPAASPKSAGSPAATAPAGSPAPKALTSPAPAAAPTSPSPAAAAAASPSPAGPASPPPWPIQTAGLPPMYSAAWHHVHLYAPRSINPDSNMPAYRFLYEKRRIAGERSAEALQLSGSDAPPQGWEIVPTYDAKCVVAYLMGLNQSHPLKEVRSVGGAPATGAAPSPAAQGASPAPAAAGSPAAPKK
jgi:cbb3-type cytochrome oxidase cytochrome c subunit